MQKLRKRDRDKEYPAIVAAERLFRRALSRERRVLAEKRAMGELEGGGSGGLKRSSFRARRLEWEVNERRGEMSLFLLSGARREPVGGWAGLGSETVIEAEEIVRDRIKRNGVVKNKPNDDYINKEM